MDYEVELKFALRSPAELESAIATLDLALGEPLQQVDRYFAHPARDFVQTDEAFRLRQIGEQNFVTYKGPRVDQETKTRQELELALPDGSEVVDEFTQLWLALGFQEVGTVKKTRREARFQWQGYECHFVHDTVEELGEFVELEMICSPAQLDAVRLAMKALTAKIGLGDPERRSYLELLQ